MNGPADFDAIEAAQKRLYPLRLPELAALHPLDQAGVSQVVAVLGTFGIRTDELVNRLHTHLSRDFSPGAVKLTAATAALATFWVHHRRPWITPRHLITTTLEKTTLGLQKLLVIAARDEHLAQCLSARLPLGTTRAAIEETRATIVASRGGPQLFGRIPDRDRDRALRMIDALLRSPATACGFSEVYRCARAQRATLEFLLVEVRRPDVSVYGIRADLDASANSLASTSASAGGAGVVGGLALEGADQERERLRIDLPPNAPPAPGTAGAGGASPEDLLDFLGDLGDEARPHDRPRG